jgi:hypothetical protein
MNDEIQVLPDAVVISGVMIKAVFCVSVQNLSINATNEASVILIFYNFSSQGSQLSKSINDNTKDNIQQNCNDNQEER